MRATWFLLQLADSAFPTGGFVHSGGLEAAVRLGLVRDPVSWLAEGLQSAGRAALPLVTAGFEGLDADEFAEAWLTNPVAHRASRAQGQAWVSTVAAVFPSEGMSLLKKESRRPGRGHFAPVFGRSGALLGLDLDGLQRLFLFLHLRGQVSVAVRLGLLGPLEAQRAQARLGAVLEEVWRTCAGLGLDDVAVTAPLVELAHGHHDRLYSRLFTT